VDWEVEYYERETGEQPVELFEDTINPKLWGKLSRNLEAVAKEKWRLGGGVFEVCHDFPDLCEIRARHSRDLGRVLCYVDRGPPERLVLLTGVIKVIGTPTPREAFIEAAGYLADYRVSRRVSPEV
jgi:hypothetical protein